MAFLSVLGSVTPASQRQRDASSRVICSRAGLGGTGRRRPQDDAPPNRSPHQQPERRRKQLNRAISAAGKKRSATDLLVAWANLLNAEDPRGDIQRNIYSYNALIDGMVRCNKPHTAEKYLHEMLERKIEPDIVTYNTLLKGCYGGTGQDLDRARRVMDLLNTRGNVQPDTVTHNSLISCFCKARDMAKAEKHYSKLIAPNSYAASAMVMGYAATRNTDQVAYMLWEQLDRHHRCTGPIQPGFYNSVLAAFVSCKAPDDALALAERIPGMAHGIRDTHADDTVIEILDRFRDVLARVAPDFWTCNTTLTAMREAQTNYRIATRFVSNLPPGLADNTTFSTLVDTMCRQGAYNQACAVLNSLVTSDSPELRPNTSFFNCMIHGLSRGGGPTEEVVDVLDLMVQLSEDHKLQCLPDASTITMVLDACAMKGDTEVAERLYSDLETSPWGRPLLHRHIAIHNCLLKCYREALVMDVRQDRVSRNWLGAARLVMRSLVEKDTPRRLPMPDRITFNTLLDLAVMNHSFDAAESIFEEMKARRLGPDRHTYNIMIKGCAKSRSGTILAFEWLDEMKRNGIRPDEYTFQALVAVSARSNDAPKALHFFKETELAKREDFRMGKRSVGEWDLPHPSAYWSLMRAYANYAGEAGLETVMRLKKEMESRNMELGAYGYATVINAQAERGHVKKVLELVKELETAPVIFKERVKYGLIVKSFCKARRIPEAVHFMENNLEVADIVAYNTVIFEAIRQDDYTSLVNVLRMMELTGTLPNQVTHQALGGILQFAATRIRTIDVKLKQKLLSVTQTLSKFSDQT